MENTCKICKEPTSQDDTLFCYTHRMLWQEYTKNHIHLEDTNETQQQHLKHFIKNNH